MTKKKNIIGISSGWWEGAHRLMPVYVQCIIDAGATPLIIPVNDDEDIISQLLDHVDGLLLTGGGDINPKYWGEELMPQSNKPSALRDSFDLSLVRLARQRCMPVLGICRGLQAMNIFFGGDIYQDIYTQLPDKKLLQHSQGDLPRSHTSHAVNIASDSLLAEIMGGTRFSVNSFHHQSLRRIAPNYRVVATSDDGIVEAVEDKYYHHIAVQWHPEELYGSHPEQAAILKWLVEEAGLYRKAREIHTSSYIIDTHTDTPMVWTEDTDLGVRQDPDNVKVDFVKMNDTSMKATFMVAYLPQIPLDSDDYRTKAIEARDTAVDTFCKLRSQIDSNSDLVRFACSADKCISNSVPSVFFGLENGFALAGDINNIEKFYNIGVRYITLCHNGDNDICDSARGCKTHGGISDFGRKVIREMNRLGIMVDVSHAADSSIEQALELSSRPIIATHTSAKALCDHPRNMSDDLIRKVAAKGGRIHVCLYNYFLAKDGVADIFTICDHISHIVSLVGSEHVGIGSDFDGGGGVPGCNDTSELINVTIELLRRGFDIEDIKNVMGRSFLRFFKENF